jgi:AcrR family transcriptional regulator
MTEIARVARTSVKRLNDRFTSKERLFAAVLIEHVEALDDRIRRTLARTDGARERLHAIVWIRACVAAERRTLGRLLLEDESIGSDVRRAYARIGARTRSAFVDGIRAGELRSELGPELSSEMFEAALGTWLVARVLGRDEEPDEDEARLVADLLLGGFAAQPGSRRRR